MVKRAGDAALVANLSIDVEALLEKRAGFVKIALSLCESSEFVKRAGDAALVTELPSNDEALLVKRARSVDITLILVNDRKIVPVSCDASFVPQLARRYESVLSALFCFIPIATNVEPSAAREDCIHQSHHCSPILRLEHDVHCAEQILPFSFERVVIFRLRLIARFGVGEEVGDEALFELVAIGQSVETCSSHLPRHSFATQRSAGEHQVGAP